MIHFLANFFYLSQNCLSARALLYLLNIFWANFCDCRHYIFFFVNNMLTGFLIMHCLLTISTDHISQIHRSKE